LQITMLTETRGYGYASTAQGPASVAYGFSEQDARGFLTVPSGMRLVANPKGGTLELQKATAEAAGQAPGQGNAALTGAAIESPELPVAPVPARGK
jgi:hypothetical protein